MAAASLVFSSLFLALLTVLPLTVTRFLLTAVLWTAGEIMVIPQQSAFVADWAPPEARA